jgi:hypothetical protein
MSFPAQKSTVVAQPLIAVRDVRASGCQSGRCQRFVTAARLRR